MIKYQKNGRQTSKGRGLAQISNKLKESSIGKGISSIGKGISSGYTNNVKPAGNNLKESSIGKGISSFGKGTFNNFLNLSINVLNLNENFTSIIYVMITILLIVHIILFINATIKIDRYSDIETNKSFFTNYPDFQYLKNDYLMEIDAFFLNHTHTNPFPYIFIFYPMFIFIVSKYANISSIPAIDDPTYKNLIILILIISVGYYISFNTFHYAYIKPKIDELRKTIKEKIIELEIITNTESDLHKNHRLEFLNILKDIIIYEIDHNIPYDTKKIAGKVFKQMQIINQDVKLENVEAAINAGNTEVSKINILKIIYTYRNPEIAGKYFSLLIDETYDENKVSYSLYYILGKCNIDFVNNNTFDEPFYGIFKGLILNLDDTFRNDLNNYTKIYYTILVSVSSFLFLLILGLYRSNINKVFMYFCRYYQTSWFFVLVIFYIAIILSFYTYHLESNSKDIWIGLLILILFIITVIIFFEQIQQIPLMFKSQ